MSNSHTLQLISFRLLSRMKMVVLLYRLYVVLVQAICSACTGYVVLVQVACKYMYWL